MDVRSAQVPAARALREAMAALTEAGRGARRLAAEERRVLLAEVDRASTVLATVRGELLLAEREAGAWKARGDRSFAAWRGRTSREGVRAAAAEERRADALAGMPALREATVAGRVSLAHVDAVSRTVATGSEAVREALGREDVQAEVTQLATRLDAGRFATALARLAARTDAAGLERDHQAQRAARFLHLADGADGTRVTGRLDRMAGYRLRLALEALSPRPAADDDRTPEQRRADALAAMADKLLSLPDTTPGAAQRPHVSFLMSAEAWAGLREAHRRAGARGSEANADAGAEANADAGAEAAAEAEADGRATAQAAEGPVPFDEGLARLLATEGPMEPVTLEDGTPVPASEVARALCDCELTRVVLDADDEPLNLGRTARTYTGAQRRAVIARDGGCFWDGCEIAPRWTEIHHIAWWDRDGGETSVDNGIAACSFHHHEVHRRDLLVRRRRLEPEERSSGRRVGYVVTTRDGLVLSGAPPSGSPEGSAHGSPVGGARRGMDRTAAGGLPDEGGGSPRRSTPAPAPTPPRSSPAPTPAPTPAQAPAPAPAPASSPAQAQASPSPTSPTQGELALAG